MAKKKNNWGNRVKDYKDFYHEKGITEIDIGDYNTEKMKIFGINVVMGRHVPAMIDGLKPGERRALYSIYKSGGKAKVANPIMMTDGISETLKIHPHGNSSVYGTMIGMGQSWKNMLPLIDSMGQNFGCADGFSSREAADRYLKVRISEYARDCFFSDFDPHIVEMHRNYDDNTDEPMYLPAKYPNLFVNGANGMAFGYSCAIPTYNPRELFAYTIKLIQDPDGKHGVIVPDSPTGCSVVDEPGVFEALLYKGYKDTTKKKEDRTATFRMRSTIEVDTEEHTLTLTSFPPQNNAKNFVFGIKELKENGTLAGCTSINNNSQGENVEIVLRFKPEVNLEETRELLYSTKLSTESAFPAQIIVIDDMKISKGSVRQALLAWIEYRRDFKRRYFNMKIVLDNARIHELEMLLFLFNGDNAEKTLKILKKAEDKEDIIHRLIKEYDIDTVKAKAVADMPNWKYSKKARKDFKEEKERLEKEVEHYEKLVVKKGAIDKEIIEELEEGIRKYSFPRRSKIIKLSKLNEIPNTEHMVVITQNGFMKKLNPDVRECGTIAPNDSPMEVLMVNNRDTLLVFDNFGRVHTIPVNTVRSCSLDSHGVPLTTYAKIDNSKIVSVFVIKDDGALKVPEYKTSEAYFLFTTRKGLIKKSPYASYISLKNSTTGVIVKKGDELVSVKFINKDTDVVVFTYNGKGLRFNSDSITETKRMSSGVKAFDVDTDDAICDTVVLSHKDTHLLVVTNKGYGKKVKLENFPTEERRKDAGIITGLREGDLMMFGKGVTDADKYKAFLVGHVEDLAVKNVPEQYRLGKGVKLIPVKRGDMIIKLAKVRKQK